MAGESRGREADRSGQAALRRYIEKMCVIRLLEKRMVGLLVSRRVMRKFVIFNNGRFCGNTK